jgi:hypothetical protein
MKQMFMLTTSVIPVFAAAAEAGAAEAPTTPVKVERQKQNGFTRPIAGTKTGLVWDIADKISADQGRPAKRDEVFAEYKKQIPDASDGTISTQYSRWCGFHGVQDVLRKMRAEEKAAEKKIKDDEKAAKAEEKAKAKAAKEAEAKEKADAKAAAAAKKAEEAAAKAKAKADAAAAKAAE